MDAFQDLQVLEKLLDAIEQWHQRGGNDPGRGSTSSSRNLRSELASLVDKCRRGEVTGRARRRQSGELFRRMISLAPEIWDS